MKKATTINFAAGAIAPSSESTINFKALVHAYETNIGLRHDIHEIFSCVGSFLYWNAIQIAQCAGITGDTLSFITQNRDAYLECPEYVENRIQSALSKVIRRCCGLNREMSARGYGYCLTRFFSKDESGWYKLYDARAIALDIAYAYEQNVGKSILETRWDLL